MENDPLFITAVSVHFDAEKNRLCYSFRIEGMNKDQYGVVTKYIDSHHSSSDRATVSVKHTEHEPLPVRTSYTRKICVSYTMTEHGETDRLGKDSAKKTALALREHLEKILA